MAGIATSKLQHFRQLAELQESEGLPSQLKGEVQPVAEVVRRYCNICRQADSATTADASIYQTPTDKDFFLCGVGMQITKDAACTNTQVRILIYLEGQSGYTEFNLFTQNTTALNVAHREWVFPIPLKVQRGTLINITGSFGAGAMTKSGMIWGYLVDA